MKLHQIIQNIETREDFIAFVHELALDFQRNPETWENYTVNRYLQAAAGWTSDMDGCYQNSGEQMPSVPTWKMFADILIAAKMYE